MKDLNQNSTGNGFLFKVLVFLLVIVTGCTKDEFTPDNYSTNQNEMNFKSLIIYEGTFALDGFTRFDVYAQKEGLVITDGHVDNFLACSAELILKDKKNFVLNTKESFILPDGSQMLVREVSFIGKITPSGQLKFSWPETWIEYGPTGAVVRTDVLAQLREHTGYNQISGPGIVNNTLNYKGNFDGNKFFAEMHIIGFQDQPGTLPFYFEVVDGPISLKFSIDLDLSN